MAILRWCWWSGAAQTLQQKQQGREDTIGGWVETPFSRWFLSTKMVMIQTCSRWRRISRINWSTPMAYAYDCWEDKSFLFWCNHPGTGMVLKKRRIFHCQVLVTSIPFDWRGWLERVYAIYGSISRFNTTQFSTWPNWYLYSGSPSTGDVETSNNLEQLRTIFRHGTRLRSTRMIKTGLSCQSTCGSGSEQRQYAFVLSRGYYRWVSIFNVLYFKICLIKK